MESTTRGGPPLRRRAEVAEGVRWLDEAALLGALSFGDAADALETALRSPDPLPVSPQRVVAAAGVGQFLAMPAGSPSCAGAKLLTIQPDNPKRGLPLIHGVFVLFSGEALEPAAVIDGAALTVLRTPAVSLVAARALARPDSRHLVVFGAGVQARAHVEAMRAELPITEVTVVDPTEAADELVGELVRSGINATRGERQAVGTADVICTCTTADVPLFDGRDLPDGVHITAMGSYQPHTREVDDATLDRATVVVENVDAVLTEAGDLRIPIADGRYELERVAGDLEAVARGRVTRSGPGEITLFKSVGVGWEDLVVAQAAWTASTSGSR